MGKSIIIVNNGKAKKSVCNRQTIIGDMIYFLNEIAMYLRNAGRDKMWWAILTALMLIGGEAFAEYQSIYNASTIDTLAHIAEIPRLDDGR
jgi:hypothetical protein